MGQIQFAEFNGIVYKIYLNEKRASVVENKSKAEHIIIPRSVHYKNKEYIITSILRKAFHYSIHALNIEFAVYSEIQTIKEDAFSESGIQSILIPPHVTQICSGAFCGCINLNHVEFPPNCELQVIEEEIFANTSIEMISIPNRVITICIRAFAACRKLKHIEFSEDSELTTIEEDVFCDSPIECITIPQKVVNLKDGCADAHSN